MISIYLCEDDNTQLRNWSRIISNYLIMNVWDIKLQYGTDSGIKLLQHLTTNPPEVGLYFLDIELKGDMTGLKLASEIRKLDPRGYIVFITTHSEMCYMTSNYKVEPLDFILKDQPEELPSKIVQCIASAWENYTTWKKAPAKYIAIKIENQYIHLDTSEIVYIESAPTVHKVLIHTLSGIMSIYQSLKSLQAILDFNQFLRCNKSAIINIDHVAKLDTSTKKVILTNDIKLSISARHYNQIKSLFSKDN